MVCCRLSLSFPLSLAELARWVPIEGRRGHTLAAPLLVCVGASGYFLVEDSRLSLFFFAGMPCIHSFFFGVFVLCRFATAVGMVPKVVRRPGGRGQNRGGGLGAGGSCVVAFLNATAFHGAETRWAVQNATALHLTGTSVVVTVRSMQLTYVAAGGHISTTELFYLLEFRPSSVPAAKSFDCSGVFQRSALGF